MAFRVSPDTFSTAFNGEDGSEKTGLKKFFEQLQKYLAQSKDPGARLMGEWLAGGERLCGFTCRGDVLRNMLAKMYKGGVPYIVAMDGLGNNGIVIRACDQEKTEYLKEEVLKERSMGEVIRVSEAAMRDNILASEYSDKRMISLYGLTRADASILLGNVSDLTDDGTLAVTQMNDGTFRISGPAVILMSRRKAGKTRYRDLTHALLLTALSTSGMNREANIKKAIDKEKFGELVASGFKKGRMDLDVTPAWIINKDPLDKVYMKVTGSGFFMGTFDIKDGSPVFTEKSFYPSGMNDYDWRLMSAAAGFSKPFFSYDINAAMDMAMKLSKQEQFLIERDADIEKAETMAAEKIDHIIEVRMANTGMRSQNIPYNDRTNVYMKDAAGLMLAAAGKAETPEGYSDKDIRDIQDIFDKNGLPVETYADRFAQKAGAIQAESREIEPARVADIESELQRFNPDYKRRPTKEELIANLTKLQKGTPTAR